MGEVPTSIRIDAKFDVPVGYLKDGLVVPNGGTVCTLDLLTEA